MYILLMNIIPGNMINKLCIKEKTLKVKAYLPSYLTFFWANKEWQKTSLHKKSVVSIFFENCSSKEAVLNKICSCSKKYLSGVKVINFHRTADPDLYGSVPIPLSG
jgi:hypothetical protein